MTLRALFAIAMISVGALAQGCGAADSAGGGEASSQSDPLPPVRVSPSPLASSASWASLQIIKDCPEGQSPCPSRNGFAIHRDGRYHYAGSPGQLSVSDLEQLRESVDRAVSDQGLGSSRACARSEVPEDAPRLSVQVYFESGSGRVVYEIIPGAGAHCWIGDRERAQELGRLADHLAVEYAPADAAPGHDHGGGG